MTDKKPTPNAPKKTLGPRSGEDAAAPDDEKGGFKDLGLPEPTRYGDWESNGRCTDF